MVPESSNAVKLVGVLICAVAILSVGCTIPDNSVSDQPVVDSNANITNAVMASPSPSASPDLRSSNIQFTLPLLDAMLSDESFAGETRKEVQLTDEELQRLRDAARNAVLNLDNAADDESRSARAAIAEARKKVQEILGNNRADRFIAFAEKQIQGDSGLAEIKPNQVPDDTRIVVNIPAYRMDLFSEGKLVKTYKIGIGYPEFPLPTGLRKASTIIFNPTWTPPDEPWVKGKVQPGKKVEAGDKLNPLGVVKIPIGLPSLIHGGKAPARLGTFASHGCVGLTDQQVQDFALELSKLAGDPISLLEIKNYAKAKTETKEVKLDESIPVELRYETIVVENGTLKIFRDVYERGTNTEENLKQVLETYGVSLDSMQADMRAKIIAALDQMSLDASGREPDASEPNNSNRSSSDSNNARVTKNIKGKKELAFTLPELKGKGYPASLGQISLR